MKLHHVVTAAPQHTPSARVLEVASMFGLGVDQQRTIELIPEATVPLSAGQIVFITGPSGSGKSTLLRLIDQRLAETGRPVWHFDRLPAQPDEPLVDCFGDAPLKRVLRWLSLAGLNDAFVMLRRPGELSDGQRYRLRLAQVMALVEAAGEEAVVLADEFGATLDRLTAAVIARNVRKWVRGSSVCFVCATTHDDLLEPLEPDVLVAKSLGSGIEVVQRERGEEGGGVCKR